ncbi:hypothetical protein XANCAGTX0491_006075 [Xanthoria calcicola]
MSNQWITVGKNNKPLRNGKRTKQSVGGRQGHGEHLQPPPQGHGEHLQPPVKLSKVPSLPPGPPKPASLLGIPPELRIQIWELCLPSDHEINLSDPPRFRWRRTSPCDTNRRCDPPVLFINRQVYEEASEVLYGRTFVVEVNCGLWLDHKDRERFTELPWKFPFHKARQIIVRMDAHLLCDSNHVFHHMLYVCGLLFLSNKSRSIESLSVEIWAADPHGRVIHSECPSWRDSGNTGFAEAFGIEESRDREEDEENVSTKHVDDRISFLLQPLALRKSVGKTEVVFCSPYKPSDNLRNTMDHYKALLRGERHTTYRDTNWLRTEYFSILAKRKECAKQIRQDREQRHEEWLRKTHEQYSCRHPRFKIYSRCYEGVRAV